MSSLLAQLQERARRRDLDERIGAFLRARYEFSRDPRHRIRRQDVYRAAAEATGADDNNEFRTFVADLAEKLGAREISPCNARLFCRMREKDPALIPVPASAAGRGPPAMSAAVRRAWFARLEQEGLGVAADGAPRRKPRPYREIQAAVKGGFFEKLTAHYWEMRRELEIWGLYALEGLSIADVAERTGSTCATVDAVVTRLIAAAAAVPPKPEDAEVDRLRHQGLTVKQIAERLGLRKNRIESALDRLSGRNAQGYETGQQDEGAAVGGPRRLVDR